MDAGCRKLTSGHRVVSAPGFAVHPAGRGDIEQVASLWAEMMDLHGSMDPRFVFAPSARREFTKHVWALARSRRACVVVATTGVHVVAYGIAELHTRPAIYPVGGYAFISDLAVTRTWQRRGVGRAVLCAMLEWMRGQSATVIELFASEANEASQQFWRAMGFGEYMKLLRMDLTSSPCCGVSGDDQ